MKTSRVGSVRALVAAVGAACSVIAAPAAHATWSIILVDTRTGEVGVASATCLTTFDLQANTPVLLTGIGAATAQSFVDPAAQNRTVIRDGLALGTDPAAIITRLSTFDPGHQTRQYGIVDTRGRAATFSGTQANAWAGGLTGQFNYTYAGKTGTIAYAIQGNILTGAAVVQASVNAAINTPGDLPARLMASMEAARVFGGDGRCSCPQGPTACGAPPPTFTKTAHIAYMLIARAGDRDGAHGYYRPGPANSVTNAAASGDFNRDGAADLVAVGSFPTHYIVLNNVTAAAPSAPPLNTRPPFPVFNALPVNNTGASAQQVIARDLNLDGLLDLTVAAYGSSAFTVHRGLAAGGFTFRQDFRTEGGPQGVAVAQLDGQLGLDVATANDLTNSVSTRFIDAAGTGFGPAVNYAMGGNPRAIVAADLDADGDQDLAVVLRDTGQLARLINNGAGVFTRAADIALPQFPIRLAAADLDADGLQDLVVVSEGAGTGFTILRNTGGGSFTTTTLALGNIAPTELAVGDVDGDGDPDILAPINTDQSGVGFAVLLNAGDGTFAQPRSFIVGYALGRPVLSDLDADGDLDASFPYAGGSGLVVVTNRGGVGSSWRGFQSGIGTGFGDYFMQFNIAFQSAQAPDPVFQLQDLYDAWRQELVARPDGVQSVVDVPRVIYAGSQGSSTITVSLRDWRGEPVTTAAALTAQLAPGSAGATSIESIVNDGGGVYRIIIRPTAIAGADRYIIRADDGVRPVTLMPYTAVTTRTCPDDWDGSGAVDVNDFFAFLTSYASGESRADIDADGDVDIDDFFGFLTVYTGGCA